MKFLDIVTTAGLNLFRNKTRSILTIIAVFVGTITITLTNGIGDGIKSYLDTQLDGLGGDNVLMIMTDNGQDEETDGPQKYDPSKVKTGTDSAAPPTPGPGPGSSEFLLTSEDLSKIKADPDVVLALPAVNVVVDYVSRPPTSVNEKYFATIDSLQAQFLTIDLKTGTQLDSETIQSQAIIPSNYVDALGFNDENDALGKDIVLYGSDQLGGGQEFTATIVGVSNASLIAGDSININATLANKIREVNNIGKTEQAINSYPIVIASFSPDLSDEEIVQLQERLESQGYKTSTMEEQQALVFGIIDAVVIVLNMFGAVALLAASFGIINTLYMAVQERTKEIGLMKALGMSKNKIFALFSIEAALLGLLGSFLGVLVANGLARVINTAATNSFLSDFEGLQLLSLQWQSVTFIVLLVTSIAFLAGTLPARRASNLDPIEALRYE